MTACVYGAEVADDVNDEVINADTEDAAFVASSLPASSLASRERLAEAKA